jgi:hypothetical protein
MTAQDASVKAAQRKLREAMRGRGMSRAWIGAEMACRYKYRPRMAWRAWRARAEHAEQLLEIERTERRELTSHITGSTSLTPQQPAGPAPTPPPAQQNGKTPAQRREH